MARNISQVSILRSILAEIVVLLSSVITEACIGWLGGGVQLGHGGIVKRAGWRCAGSGEAAGRLVLTQTHLGPGRRRKLSWDCGVLRSAVAAGLTTTVQQQAGQEEPLRHDKRILKASKREDPSRHQTRYQKHRQLFSTFQNDMNRCQNSWDTHTSNIRLHPPQEPSPPLRAVPRPPSLCTTPSPRLSLLAQ
ncbi:hypothetical protein E2C01_048396 [Portunus trituberculatus]|uniref:Uncharacterized protein n=1 Tax=Portunus trituberculatus TaxID=210409 RepID=A0A5B7GBH4_PORTR|nr:hypothetical protein [Portunus trituberculatus]